MPPVTTTPKDMGQVSSMDLISEFIGRTHTALWTGMTVILLVPIAQKGLETGLATQFTHSIVCHVVATSLIGGLSSFGFDGVDYLTKTTCNAALNWGKKKLKLSCDRVSANIPTLWHRANPSTSATSSTNSVSNASSSVLPQEIPSSTQSLPGDERENKRTHPHKHSYSNPNGLKENRKTLEALRKKASPTLTTRQTLTTISTPNPSQPPKRGILRRVAGKMTEILKDTLLRECE